MPLPGGPPVTGRLPCDILLIQPPVRDYYLTTKRTVPYGLISIAAALRKRGFAVAVLDALARGKSRPAILPAALEYLATVYATEDLSPFALFHQYRHFGYAIATIAESARLSGAFLIGISSLFSAYEDMALACSQAIKARAPEAFIVLGGHHPTAFPERVLDHPGVDFVLRGDGEAGMPPLAETLRRGGPLSAVPGIVFNRRDGKRHLSPPAYVADLEQLPPPAVDLVKTRYYRRNGQATLVIAASRGCPMSCSYCCMGAHSRVPYRRRSVAHVMREIIHAADNHDIGLIDFEDENLALDGAWFAALLHGIMRHFGPRRPELRAMNGLFPAALNQDTVALMHRAGFRELNLSLGSCSRRQMRRFNRPATRAAFDRALKWAEWTDMTAVGYLIAGAPGQDPLSSIDDLLFMASRRVLAGLSIYYPAPDSLDFERCRTDGLLPLSPLCWRSSALPLDQATSRAEGVTLLRLARILNFMKACVDEDGGLPSAQAPPRRAPRLSGTRHDIGRQLLRWFLGDGILRGVRSDGEVVTYPTAAALTRAFIAGITKIPVRGVRH